MKKILIICILSCVAAFETVQAQQIHQLTQYMLNDFAYNPAVAGSSDKFITKFGFRKQWTGIEGAPTTIYASINGNLSQKKTVGLGAVLFSDATGPTSRMGLQLAYAYQLPLNLEGSTQLGFGISATLMQASINYADMVIGDVGDPQLGSGSESKLGADANFGVYLRGTQYSVGLAANQLFASKFNFLGTDTANIQNARHFYLMGNYMFDINEKFSIQPGLLLKMVKGTNPQAEINARAIYDKQYWLGLSYRTEDAIAAMLGVQLQNGFNVAYSYDITTSGLNSVSGGVHEITLGYDFSIFE
jgi:type IX secretion system PorP/SprF family membrane protein